MFSSCIYLLTISIQQLLCFYENEEASFKNGFKSAQIMFVLKYPSFSSWRTSWVGFKFTLNQD
jgi:hypothetical protein